LASVWIGLAFNVNTGTNSNPARKLRSLFIRAPEFDWERKGARLHRGASVAVPRAEFCQADDTTRLSFLFREKCPVPDRRASPRLLQMNVAVGSTREEATVMAVSEDVLRLVRAVERLPSEDQDKILRMVDLLTLVPVRVQNQTQRMLRELLERQPDTKRECVAGVDDVLEYLERNAAAVSRARDPGTRVELGAFAKLRPS
jgi:hypothetical protein